MNIVKQLVRKVFWFFQRACVLTSVLSVLAGLSVEIMPAPHIAKGFGLMMVGIVGVIALALGLFCQAVIEED